MSKDNRDRLEIEINRYLDGEISDDDFEKFLESRPEDFDLDSFRSLKTRVEKIEDLYLQLEEPAVPDGYWETFADRVDEKIGVAHKSSTWEKLLNIILPTRWPKMAFGYAGALASVLLVFVIGKTIMESGADKYTPTSYQTPVIVEKPAEEPAKDEVEIGDETRSKRVELPKSSGGLEPAVVGKVEIDREKKSDADEFTVGKGQTAGGETPGPVGDGQTAKKEELPAVPVPETASDDHEMASWQLNEVAAAPDVDIAQEMLQMPKPIAEGSTPQIVVEEPIPIPPVEEQESLSELSDLKLETRESAKSVATQHFLLLDAVDSNPPKSSETKVWKYDNWNLEDLRIRLKFYEAIVDDSAFSSETFSEYAEIRSSVAILTRDSIDIYDAVNTIDTLLNYNQQIDRPTWMQRREHIRSIRNSMTNP